jgi:hypothetical protein
VLVLLKLFENYLKYAKNQQKKILLKIQAVKHSRPVDDVDEADDTTHDCSSTDNSCGEKTIKKVKTVLLVVYQIKLLD